MFIVYRLSFGVYRLSFVVAGADLASPSSLLSVAIRAFLFTTKEHEGFH